MRRWFVDEPYKMARLVLVFALLGLAACRDTFDEWRKQVYILHRSTCNIYVRSMVTLEPFFSTTKSMPAKLSMRDVPRYLLEIWTTLKASTENATPSNVNVFFLKFFFCWSIYILSFLVGVNKFMDLSFDEFETIYLSAPQVLLWWCRYRSCDCHMTCRIVQLLVAELGSRFQQKLRPLRLIGETREWWHLSRIRYKSHQLLVPC